MSGPSLPAPQGSMAVSSLAAPGRHTLPYVIFFTGYALFAVYFYITQARPYLETFDLYIPRMLADSIAYQTICVSGEYYFDWITLRDIGPCVMLKITDYNMALLSIANASMIALSIVWLARTYRRPWRKLLFLAMINPITFLSIFGPNKEVFGLVSVITLAIFVRSRSGIALLLCLIAALFTRIPAFATIAAFCLGASVLPKVRPVTARDIRFYRLLILGMIAVVSVLVLVAGSALQFSLLGDVSGAEDISQSTAISLSLDTLSQYGLYVVAYLARMALNLYSGVIGIGSFGRGGVGIYYGVGVAWSSLYFLAITLYLVARRPAHDINQTAIGWNLIVFVALFTVTLCISPVIQHRYFYPIQIILLLFATRPLADAAAQPALPYQRADAGAASRLTA